MDLSIQHLDVPGDHLVSGGYGMLVLAVRASMSEGYILAPDPDTGHQDYTAHLYLSVDAHIDQQVDVRVLTLCQALGGAY